MGEVYICSQCKDTGNPVTPSNGGAIVTLEGGLETPLVRAYVHKACKDAWARGHGGVTFDALTWPCSERRIRCARCGKAFEVVGDQGSGGEMRVEAVPCPYDNCGEPARVAWPKKQPLLVRKIPSEM